MWLQHTLNDLNDVNDLFQLNIDQYQIYTLIIGHKTVFYIYEQLSPNKLHKASWESYSTTKLGLTKEKQG